jgi:hypothetical protein
MSYDKQILKILHEAGDSGIRINILAKNVFNESNSLFGELTYSVVYNYVRAYVRKNSQSPDALIVSMEQRGFYRINKMMVTQLQLNFLDEDEPVDCNDDVKKDCEDLSLSLF